MRGVAGALTVLAAGCLSAPPASIPLDGAPGEDGAGGGAADAEPGVDCPELPDLAPFADDFTTGDLAWAVDPKPSRDGVGEIAMSVSGGELVFTPGADGNDYAWLQTMPFDFGSGRIAIEITQLTTDASSSPYLGIIGPAGEERMLRYDGSHITTPTDRSVLYIEEAHRWLQILSDAGLFHYQVSQDGVLWEDIDSAPPGFAVDQVLFEIGINVDVGGPVERGQFAVDDLDLPPCGG